MYRITYEQGNGYYCNCCRKTFEETYDVQTAEDVQDWVNELFASYKVSIYEDEDDRELISIEKEIGVDIQDQFEPEQEVVDKLVAERKAEKAEEKRLDKEEREKDKEEREQKEYLRLKEKYK